MIDYTQWQPDPFLLADAPIIVDYAEYSGEDPFEVASKVSNFHKLTQTDFVKYGAKFYGESKSYIYDILSGNPSAGVRANLVNKFIPNCVRIIKEHPGKTFADFGAGVGAMCEVAHTFCRKDVTYIDVESHSTHFALWRFVTHGWDIEPVIIQEDDFELKNSYDIIFSDAVWEHLPPNKQLTYATKLVNAVNTDGLFILLVDLSGANANMPMHFDVDIHKVHDTIADAGMTCFYGRNNFASLWSK